MVYDIDLKSAVEKWITKNTYGYCRGYRKDIITFIANIRFHCNANNPSGSTEITHLFGSGYCFYFAKILQTAFGGEIYWHQNHGHIVWSDDGKHFYDIDGPFRLYDELWELVPIGFLGSMINDFKHVDEYKIVWSLYSPLVKWKRENYPYESDAAIISTIFMGMPPYTEYHPGDTIESEVFKFWQKYPDECKRIVDEAIANS